MLYYTSSKKKNDCYHSLVNNETLNFLTELNFADGRILVHSNQLKCGKFLSPLTFLLCNK